MKRLPPLQFLRASMPNLSIGIGLLAYAGYGVVFTSTTRGIQPESTPVGFALTSIGSAALLGVLFVAIGVRRGLARGDNAAGMQQQR